MANKNFKARIGIEAPLIAADNGTTAITLSDNDVTIVGDLTVTSNTIKSSTGATAISLSADDVTVSDRLFVVGNIIGSNGGYTALTFNQNDVAVEGDLTVTGNDIKSSSATAITLSGANVILPGTLDVQGGSISDSTGALSITTGASDGNITLDPNGTGDVVLTFANGGNLTNSRNYVFGTIRNSTADGLGDIWAVNTTGTVFPFRGINLDNSLDTTRGPATVLRSFSGGAVSGAGTRGRIIFEKARGTSASPTALQSGDFFGSVDATGYTSTGWLNDTVSVTPAFYGFTVQENWVSNTNLGTGFALSLAPTATTISSGANLITCMSVNPQTFASRSDAFTWANGKTGTTQTMALDVSGNLTITGDLRVNGNDIKSSGNTSQIIMSSAGATLELRGDNIQLEDAAGTSIKGGQISYRRTFGCFHKVANVTAAAADTVYNFDWTTDVTPHVNNKGITVSNTSRINFDQAGDYNVVIEMVGKNVDNADRTAYIWLAKNGTDLAETAIKLVLTKDTTTMLAKDWLVDGVAANDYLEVRFAVDTTVSGISLEYTASQASPYVRPAVASATITITPVGA